MAAFKMIKGTLSILVGLGLLELIHADIATWFSLLPETLRLNEKRGHSPIRDARHLLLLPCSCAFPHKREGALR
jgi:hypothetical protein